MKIAFTLLIASALLIGCGKSADNARGSTAELVQEYASKGSVATRDALILTPWCELTDENPEEWTTLLFKNSGIMIENVRTKSSLAIEKYTFTVTNGRINLKSPQENVTVSAWTSNEIFDDGQTTLLIVAGDIATELAACPGSHVQE